MPVGADQPPPVPATATGDDQQGLAEIIVTAQKREQSLHDVPISVTAVGSEQLRDINASDLTDVALYVPNARVDTADQGSPQVFRSEEHTSELQSLMRISYAVFCLKKKTQQ